MVYLLKHFFRKIFLLVFPFIFLSFAQSAFAASTPQALVTNPSPDYWVIDQNQTVTFTYTPIENSNVLHINPGAFFTDGNWMSNVVVTSPSNGTVSFTATDNTSITAGWFLYTISTTANSFPNQSDPSIFQAGQTYTFTATIHPNSGFFDYSLSTLPIAPGYNFGIDSDDGTTVLAALGGTILAAFPTTISMPNVTIPAGSTYTTTGSFTDPNATSWTATVNYGNGSGVQSLPLSGTTFSLNNTYTSSGTFPVTVDILDNLGYLIIETATITVNSVLPPTISMPSNTAILEGGSYMSVGSFIDQNSTSWTATVNYGDGSGIQPLTLNADNTFALSHTYIDEGLYPIAVQITGNDGLTGTAITTITVNNAHFTIGSITISTPVAQINTALTASVTFTDPGILDTHTASWDWGDGTTTTGTVSESNGSGSISDNHIYTTPGVYTVTLTVTDDDGLSNTQLYQYISVYNPTSQGLFSAGSKFLSPAGAYTQNAALTSDVKFGLSYKYQGTSPVGDRQFTMNFKNANLQFNATTVNALVIANGIGTLTGTGTINGLGTYNFLIAGSETTNTIRIQITDSSNNVIYDTQPGAPATATPTTSVSGHVLAH